MSRKKTLKLLNKVKSQKMKYSINLILVIQRVVLELESTGKYKIYL